MAKKGKNADKVIQPEFRKKSSDEREKRAEIAAQVDRQITRRATVLLLLCGILVFALLVGRLWKLMIVDHAKYESAAVETQIRTTNVSATRGTIYDTEGEILAQSATVETIYISPYEMMTYHEDAELIAAALSELLDVDYDTIMNKWKNTSSWYEVVKKKVERETADKVRAFKNENNLVSVHLIEDSKRYYPYGTLAAQVLGFVGTDNYGLEGIEAKYESILKGENGKIVRTTNARGRDLLFTGYEDYHDAEDGNSIVLTINNRIQYYLKKNMEQAIADNKIRSGAMGIVMEVKTGAILGMCTLDDYDCNSYQTLNKTNQKKLDDAVNAGNMSEDELNEYATSLMMGQWRNRAIADTYEPGSTFKIITLAAALEENVVDDDDLFECTGSMEVKGRTSALHCWKDAPGHGWQTLAESAQHSCNVAFATIGLRLGAKVFYDYMEAFGFFEKTGIDLPGEAGSIWWPASQFEDPNNYSQLAAASFGQTFNITPIQLITAVSAVANGGYLMKPHVIQQVLDADGNVIQNYSPTVVRQVVSEKTSKKVCEILESVVAAPGATGKNASVAGYSIGGKTATSEKVGQASDEYMVSFLGIAPADDPQIAVLVIFDNPDPYSGIYISGGVMAAPCVGNIMADILPYLGVREAGDVAVNSAVPNVKSMDVTEAAKALRSQGFGYKLVGNGSVVTDQAPIGGIKVADGTTVVLYAGESKPTEKVIVPDMIGKSFHAAKQYFEAFGLFIKTVGVAPSDSSTIVVQRQGVEAGTTVNYGTVIEVGLIDNDTSIMETRG